MEEVHISTLALTFDDRLSESVLAKGDVGKVRLSQPSLPFLQRGAYRSPFWPSSGWIPGPRVWYWKAATKPAALR